MHNLVSPVVVKDEAYTVRAIYNLYRRGSTMEDIAKFLNDGQIPAKKGGQWNKQSIGNILHNPIYAGYMDWDGIVRKGEQEAIIPVNVYESINGPLPSTESLRS